MTSSTIAAATMDMTVKIGITLPKSVIQNIDQRRGDIPRSRYIRRAIERYVGNNNSKDIDNNRNNKRQQSGSSNQKKEEEIGK